MNKETGYQTVRINTTVGHKLKRGVDCTKNKLKSIVIEEKDEQTIPSNMSEADVDAFEELRKTLASCVALKHEENPPLVQRHGDLIGVSGKDAFGEDEVTIGSKRRVCFEDICDDLDYKNLTVEDSLLENLNCAKVIASNHNDVNDTRRVSLKNSQEEQREKEDVQIKKGDITDNAHLVNKDKSVDGGDDEMHFGKHLLGIIPTIDKSDSNDDIKPGIISLNSKVQLKKGNFHTSDDTFENDVIIEVLGQGRKQRAWESMKTKRKQPQKKKVIYPVIVREGIKRDELLETDKDIEKLEPQLPGPLHQFQNSLEDHIKELVVTLQNLHSVEKDVLVNTLKNQQEQVNKDTLEEVRQIITEKNFEQKKTSSDRNACKECACSTTDAEGGKKEPDVEVKKSFSVKDEEAQTTCGPLYSSHSSLTDAKQMKLEVVGSAAKDQNLKVPVPKRKVTPRVSILKTPIRRKKAPTPLMEKCSHDKSASSTVSSTSSSGPVSALLQEILYNACTLNEVPTKDEIDKPNSGVCNIKEEEVEPSVENKIKSTQSSQGGIIMDHALDKNSCIEFTNNGALPVVQDIETENIVPETSNNRPKSSSDHIQRIIDRARTNAKSVGNCHVTKACSLDERINKARADFVNSENEWLYKSNDNSANTLTTLEKAKKVLQEATITNKILKNDDCAPPTFKNQEDVCKYFEDNPYLVDKEVVRTKRNVDENIKKIKPGSKKKISRKTMSVVKPRFPLKEKNS